MTGVVRRPAAGGAAAGSRRPAFVTAGSQTGARSLPMGDGRLCRAPVPGGQAMSTTSDPPYSQGALGQWVRRLDIWRHALTSHWRRLDFSQSSLDDLGLSSARSVFYDDSGGPDLATVLKQIPIPPGSVALDYGSGKGGALITLAEFPFSEVVGVEISPALIDVAVENLRRSRVDNVRVINCDAAAFQDLDRVTHIYMYHPFRGEVVDAVLSNVQASLARAARRLTLIYKNPVYHHAIAQSGTFRLQRELHLGRAAAAWGRYHVYVHDPGASVSGQSSRPSIEGVTGSR